MDETLLDAFLTALQQIPGMVCWSAQVSGVGSLISLEIGDKIPREQPMIHPGFKLSDEERRYRGTFTLYVEDCPWRIENTESVLATWQHDHDGKSPLSQAVAQLIDARITDVQLTRPGLDLAVFFENGLVLRVFPDQIDPEVGDNYALVHISTTYVVAAMSTLYKD